MSDTQVWMSCHVYRLLSVLLRGPSPAVQYVDLHGHFWFDVSRAGAESARHALSGVLGRTYRWKRRSVADRRVVCVATRRRWNRIWR